MPKAARPITQLRLPLTATAKTESGVIPAAWRPLYFPMPTCKLKESIRKRDNYTCQICGKHPAKHVDHIIPLSISHNNDPANLRVLCHACNMRTGNIFKKKAKGTWVGNAAWVDSIRNQLAELRSCKVTGM